MTGELFFPAALHLRLDRRGPRSRSSPARPGKGLVLGAALEFLVSRRRGNRRCPRRDRDVERNEPGTMQVSSGGVNDRQEHKGGEEQIDSEGQAELVRKVRMFQFAHQRRQSPTRLK
jgi:hypothetical protein